jgi:uncharacterized protein (DUF2141 family)
MKTVLIGTIAASLLSCVAAPAFAEDVTVTLYGVEARGGHILASLQTKDEFMQPKGHYGAMADSPKTNNATLTLTFKDVAPGEYSLTVMHDADDNKQMKMAGAMPAEGWAMHNGTMLTAEPTWDAVSFKVGKGGLALSEPMTYPQK